MNCTRCDTTGFLNLGQVDDATLARFDATGDVQVVVDWMAANPGSDVGICDCCGDGEGWYGQPGEHAGGEGEPARCG